LNDLASGERQVIQPFGQRRILFSSVAVLLLLAASCAKVTNFVESSDPYRTETYKEIHNKWSREARIHRGLEVELIACATFKTKEFRHAYADEYVQAYKLTSERKKQLVEDELRAADLSHEFLMASFVPQKKWDEFDKVESMWKLYLVNDTNERVAPFEVRRVRGQKAITSHFFPFVTPWKSVYAVRFPFHMPGSNRPIIGNQTKEIGLVITSVLGTAKMTWKLE
jgi:hypothetical protein